MKKVFISFFFLSWNGGRVKGEKKGGTWGKEGRRRVDHHSMQLLSRSQEVCSYRHICFDKISIFHSAPLFVSPQPGHHHLGADIKQTPLSQTGGNVPGNVFFLVNIDLF